MTELADGQWCAFEIKLGANQIDTAAENLLKIKRQIEEDPRGKPPAVLCVLCGMSNAAYRRADGVFCCSNHGAETLTNLSNKHKISTILGASLREICEKSVKPTDFTVIPYFQTPLKSSEKYR